MNYYCQETVRFGTQSGNYGAVFEAAFGKRAGGTVRGFVPPAVLYGRHEPPA